MEKVPSMKELSEGTVILKCNITQCKTTLKRNFVRIWNNPGGATPYNDYCIPCGRRILEAALARREQLSFEHQVHTRDHGVIYWKLYAKKEL